MKGIRFKIEIKIQQLTLFSKIFLFSKAYIIALDTFVSSSRSEASASIRVSLSTPSTYPDHGPSSSANRDPIHLQKVENFNYSNISLYVIFVVQSDLKLL